MRIRYLTLLNLVPGFALMIAGGCPLQAQITEQIQAHINHAFSIGNTTLPPGDYTFRMDQNSDLSLMTASNSDGKTTVEFLVRESLAPTRPNHSELVFDRYGTHEFLAKVYQNGSRDGVAVDESSRQRSRLEKHGQHAVEHTE